MTYPNITDISAHMHRMKVRAVYMLESGEFVAGKWRHVDVFDDSRIEDLLLPLPSEPLSAWRIERELAPGENEVLAACPPRTGVLRWFQSMRTDGFTLRTS